MKVSSENKRITSSRSSSLVLLHAQSVKALQIKTSTSSVHRCTPARASAKKFTLAGENLKTDEVELKKDYKCKQGRI
jgi:hypothetical protein